MRAATEDELALLRDASSGSTAVALAVSRLGQLVRMRLAKAFKDVGEEVKCGLWPGKVLSTSTIETIVGDLKKLGVTFVPKKEDLMVFRELERDAAERLIRMTSAEKKSMAKSLAKGHKKKQKTCGLLRCLTFAVYRT